MPRLASVDIPLYDVSSSSGVSDKAGHKRRVTLSDVRTKYGDGSLPIKPSDQALADARIVGRVLDDYGAFYSLKIGDVELHKIALHEILEYVSAEHLEDFENQLFVEEATLLQIVEAEEQRVRIAEAERREERAKAVYYAQDERGAGRPDGEGGRARPTYKHLFLEAKVRRRRKRDPQTGELLPLSGDESGAEASQSSGDDSPALINASSKTPHVTALLENRRRRRDPVTGDLLPLAPKPEAHVGEHKQHISLAPPPRLHFVEQKKRRRRRRHPRTGELMPYGWRYEPPEPSVAQPSSSRLEEAGNMSPAMNRLSISHEPQAKRLKVEDSPPGATLAEQAVIPDSAFSDRESSSEEGLSLPEKVLSPASDTPKMSQSRGRISLPAMLQSAATSSVPESSPEPGPNKARSMMQPATGPDTPDEQSSEDDAIDEGEWVIENILAHHMSDPNTHPPELGKHAVMLYQVKWENFETPTWEPVESFPDRSVIEDYERRIKAPATVHASGGKAAISQAAAEPRADPNATRLVPPPAAAPGSTHKTSDESEASADSDSEDGSFVVKAITAHRMSDPRTHGPDFGKDPVMLYKVSWIGYKGFTWEPITSFVDIDVVRKYRKSVGLPELRVKCTKPHQYIVLHSVHVMSTGKSIVA
ncbi:hypothetical protein LTR53_017400 [Teratosphaeriaceae sp. CCFEE 6253]|nr:hypothetical protein LTR53_017400 [Teratosphaeriaceae sp. CCFEE 6253]